MFTPETPRFLSDLAANNTRDWFTANRARYEAVAAAPARAFCTGMEAALSRRHGAPVVGKIYRLNRDLRFSRDKTPYNTHIRLGFGDPRTPFAWMVGLETDHLVIGYGVFAFDHARLDRWRAAVDGPQGAALAETLGTLTAGGLRLDEPALKRVPAPYDKDHPRGALLRHKGLALWNDALPLDALYGAGAVDRMVNEFARFDPLRDWAAQQIGAGAGA
jgi:uncharacterized protein (TIGR02453 family)